MIKWWSECKIYRALVVLSYLERKKKIAAVVVEINVHDIAQVDLKLKVILFQPPECYDY